MNTYKDVIEINTKDKIQIINITNKVEDICKKSKLKEGLVLVFPYHTSSAVYLNDSDSSLTFDYLKVLNNLIPLDNNYEHDKTDYKKNAHGHLKSIISGHHITLALTNGNLDLGTYQTIYYAEFDGCRKKEILVKIIGE